MPSPPMPPPGDAVPDTLRESLERFLTAHPDTDAPQHAPAVATLRHLAHFIDRLPSAPLFAQWQVALGRLQRALLKEQDKPASIDDLLGEE